MHLWHLVTFIILLVPSSRAAELKTTSYTSPKITISPGSVKLRFFYDIDFPRGHVALKSFTGEVVDEDGNPIPLTEAYVHHWAVERYFQKKGAAPLVNPTHKIFHDSDHIYAGNSGICQGNAVSQHFAIGSETRGTNTLIPDPYAIVIGDPAEIPAGYEEKWLLNVHVIDTRGVVDKLKCAECQCRYYNGKLDDMGPKMPEDYIGGMRCCADEAQCMLKEGFSGTNRAIFLKYTVKWKELDGDIIPVKIFILDVTDTGRRTDKAELAPENGCTSEYDVPKCDTSVTEKSCVDVKATQLSLPVDGYFVYGVGHQHAGGIGTTLFGEDQRVICHSVPMYGHGREVGDEDGYIVGMTVCKPTPGSVKIRAHEEMLFESRYNNTELHTGVMGLFYFLVAERVPMKVSENLQVMGRREFKKSSLATTMFMFGVGGLFGFALHFLLRKKGSEEYYPVNKP